MLRISDGLLTEAKRVQEVVAGGMIGRLGDPGVPIAALSACFAVLAGHGDHCEIGVLYGGSALTVAMLKASLGIHGKVVCIDPLDGYYVGREGMPGLNYPNTKLAIPINVETLIENARRCGVLDRIEIIQEKSSPWPVVLRDRSFVSGFIDGDHWGDAPYEDFLNLASRTSRFILFDNMDDGSANGFSSVSSAVEKAASLTSWQEAYRFSRFVALENVQ